MNRHLRSFILIVVFPTFISSTLLDKRGSQAWDALRCETDEVACLDQRRCIPKARVCDSQQDCIDNSDELDCENSCRGDAFRCSNGKCIPKKWVCDSFDDCGDSSDEIHYCLGLERLPCSQDSYRCEEGPCIPIINVCDGKKNCPRGDDESRCREEVERDHTKDANSTPREGPLEDFRTRAEWYFRPENSMSLRYPDSIYPSISSSPAQSQPGSYQLPGKQPGSTHHGKLGTRKHQENQGMTRMNREPLLHLVSMDSNGSDGLGTGPKDLICSDHEFKCLDNLRCVPRSSRCDHRFDCVDQSDEKNCINDPCVYGLFRCQGGKCAISSWHCNATDWTGRRVTVMSSDFEAFL